MFSVFKKLFPKKLFKRRSVNIMSAAVLIAFFSFLSKILGIVRDRILAGSFGAGEVLDAYFSSFRVPDIIYNLVILGALSAGFIPVFSSLIKKMKADDSFHFSFSKEENKEAWYLVSNILNILLTITIFLSILGIIFAPTFVSIIAPGFSDELRQLTIKMTRIMFLSPIFLGVSSVFGGALQSFKKFLAYSLAPIFYNSGIIIGALFFVPALGPVGLAWGVVFGAFLHMSVQFPSLKAMGFSWRRFINFRDKNLKRIFSMTIPRTLSLAVAQVNLLVITIIASSLPRGSLAVFNLADNLQNFPVGIFGISFAVAAFPTLSSLAREKKQLVKHFSHTFRQILFLMIPSTVLLITLRAQIIRIILGTGEFSWRDTMLTMDTLGFFALSLFAQATIPLLTRVFYARENSKTPFYVGVVTVVSNIFLSLYLGKKMGVPGLALSFSLTNILNFMILWILLYFELGDLDQKRIMISVSKFTGAALLAGFSIQLGKIFIWPYIDMTTFMGVLIQAAVASFSGLVVYLLACYLLRSKEMLDLWVIVKNRIPFLRKKTKEPSFSEIKKGE